MKFLLEVGCEEIPDWMLPPAVEHLREQMTELLKPLGGVVTLAEATPRRLAIMADEVAAKEGDQTQVVKGPPVAAPPQAVEGFARKQGIAASDLVKEGAYYQFTKTISGRAALDVLAEKLPSLILGIPWPKTMLWPGKGGARFIRPIRWLMCLLDDQVIPFEINGVRTGNLTDGHRLHGSKAVAVTVDDYERVLDENGVILRASKRREKLLKEVGQDTPLIDLHIYLNEWPTAVRGTFDPSYLTLPEEVLVTVMKYHQKYFAVHSAEGGLAPEFVAVMNHKDDQSGVIRHGHERVLRARFNDARFFYDVDQKKRLSDRLEDLKNVTFQKDIGSYYEKTMRVVALCDDEISKRAALLSKCDLTTDMVKEFTELQGIIGGRYAKVQGETHEVGQAIYEQYKPASMEDSIPATIAGQKLALYDKWDTLVEMFRVGQMPTGSKDPFALRRAAQGIVRILAEGDITANLATENQQLKDFLLDRIRYYFRDVKGFAWDEVNAVLAAGHADLKDVHARLKAVREARRHESFDAIAAGFKRINNILKQAGHTPGTVNERLLEAGPEADLWHAFNSVRGQSDKLAALVSLRPAVDAFFDKVLVNAPDAAVRSNRLTLLFSLLAEFSGIADFSEIVTNQ